MVPGLIFTISQRQVLATNLSIREDFPHDYSEAPNVGRVRNPSHFSGYNAVEHDEAFRGSPSMWKRFLLRDVVSRCFQTAGEPEIADLRMNWV